MQPELLQDSRTDLLVTWQLSLERKPLICSYLAIFSRVACWSLFQPGQDLTLLLYRHGIKLASLHGIGDWYNNNKTPSTIHYLYHDMSRQYNALIDHYFKDVVLSCNSTQLFWSTTTLMQVDTIRKPLKGLHTYYSQQTAFMSNQITNWTCAEILGCQWRPLTSGYFQAI